MSHLTQVRGLKYSVDMIVLLHRYVAPHAGAWIEIIIALAFVPYQIVAPHAGAWIEISSSYL